MVSKEISTIEQKAASTVLNNHDSAVMAVNYALKKAKDSFLETLIKGFMGGMYIALGYMGFILVYSSLHHFDTGLAKFLGAFIFPVGLMLCVFVGGDLFTGNALIGMGVLLKKVTINKLFSNWTAVLIGNFLGGTFTAFMLVKSGAFYGAVADGLLVVTDNKIHISLWQMVISAFFCNILVADGIWMGQSVSDGAGRILASWFVIMLFALSGYHHVVANMFLYTAASFIDGSPYHLSQFILPLCAAAFGNALSGAVFLPLVYKYLYLKNY